MIDHFLYFFYFSISCVNIFPSDIAKPASRKLKMLSEVRDGSTKILIDVSIKK